MKKAIIDQILLSGMLLVIIIVFVATVTDEKQAREKVYDLKKVTDTSVLAMGNYYLDQIIGRDEDTVVSEAETISNNILDETKLGKEVKPTIEYTWDLVEPRIVPKTVTATIPAYAQSNFWYRFLDLDFFQLSASSTAFLDNGETNNFVPIAINGCSRTFSEGDTFDYLLKSQDLYDVNDNVGFFGLENEPFGGGQAEFAHLKNLIDAVMADKDSYYDFDQLPQSITDSLSADIHNDTKQVSSSFDHNNFSPTPMSIVEVGCGSSRFDMQIERVFEITMNTVLCGVSCNNPLSGNCSLNNLDGEVFNDTNWDNANNSCNHTDFLKINFTIDKIREREVILQ